MRVALIGLGRWGMVHLKTLLDIRGDGGFKLALYDEVEQARTRAVQYIAERLGLENGQVGYGDGVTPEWVDSSPFTLQRILNGELRCDRAIVATPARTHFELARRLMVVCPTVLVEKPFAITAREARWLETISTAHDSNLYDGSILRWHPVAQKAAELILSHDVPMRIEMANLSSGFAPTDVYGGRIWDLGIHFVDFLRSVGFLDLTVHSIQHFPGPVTEILFRGEAPRRHAIRMVVGYNDVQKFRRLSVHDETGLLVSRFDLLEPIADGQRPPLELELRALLAGTGTPADAGLIDAMERICPFGRD